MAGLMIAIANSISSNYVSGIAGPSYDPDAEAFFTAEAGAGVTLSDTEKTAINTLVVNLKAANIWTKFKALYPFIGSTATSQKFNLINPADTNAAFRLTFNGGWSHSSTGANPAPLGTNTNAFANTYFVPTSNYSTTNGHLSYYATTNTSSPSFGAIMGSVYLSGDYRFTYLGTQGNQFYPLIASGTTGGTGLNYTATRFNSLLIANRNNASTQDGWDDNKKTALARAAYAHSAYSVYIGARNNTGTADNYGTQECKFASIGTELTDLEAQVFNQIVEGYQFTLGRNMSPSQSFYYNTAYNNETNAFLYSTQITDTTTQVATNTLVNDLKAAGVWTKMKAVYPMAGSTATTQKYNLVNSQDTNAAFRLSFVGGWTHSSLGATPNGTNAYANTFLNTTTNLSLNSGHLSFYSRTNSVDASLRVDIGSLKSIPDSYSDLQVGSNNLSIFRFNNGTIYNSVATTNTLGFYSGSRTASNIIKLFKNGSIIVNGTASSSATSLTNFYLGAANSNGTALYYSTKQCAFASIGDSLTDTEAANFYTAVQNFQTTLGRAIFLSPPTVSDSDAQAFINAANIIDQAEATAVNNLTIGLKADNLWTKMKAIYPFVGSSATSQKYNLKNPLDTNAAFRLTFAGGMTHSFTGAKGNGTNAYANTFFVPNGNLTLYNGHLSFYNRTSAFKASTAGVMLGVSENSGTYDAKEIFQIGSNIATTSITASQPSAVTATEYAQITGQALRDGFWINTRTSSAVTSLKLVKNGSVVANSTTNATGVALNLYSVYMFAHQSRTIASPFAQNFDDAECAFASIGDGLSDTEAANLNTRVQTFNTTLNRQV